MDRYILHALGIVVGCLYAYVKAENAYGDNGIVFTALAAKIDEEYMNIVSVPKIPGEIDNTTAAEEYPGFNFGFVFRRPLSCAVDYSMNHVYVYDYHLRGLLLLENYNSSAIKEEITISRQHYGISQEYTKVVVDWISHNVYWTDPLMNWIAMQPGGPINEPSRYKVIVHKHLKLPRGLAIDPIAGYLFWSDYSETPIIERSTLTGGERTTLVYTKLSNPDAIVVDTSQERIYWADLQFIDSATYDGTERMHIVRGNNVRFFDMALFRDVLITTDLYNYVSGRQPFHARFYDKTTGKELTDQRMTVSREVFFGVCMYHGETQPANPEQDRCKTTGCEDLCVNEPTKATCMCREGFMLNADGNSCKEQGGQHHRAVVISTGKNLCLLDIRILSDQHDYTPVCFYNGTGNNTIQFFDVNMNTREVYFALGSTLNSVYIDKGADGQYSNKKIINEQSFDIIGMSYDYARERLYFAVGSDPQEIWFIDINTRNTPARQQVVNRGNLRSLTVVPTQNKLYWLAGTNVLEYVDLAGVDTAEITNVTLGLPLMNVKHMVHDSKYELLYVLVEGVTGLQTDLMGVEYNGSVTNYLVTDKEVIDFIIYKEYVLLVNEQDDGKHAIRTGDLGLGYPLQVSDEGTFSGVDNVYGLRILDDSLHSNITNPCGPSSNNGGCEHTCLTVDNSAQCTCKLGFTLHSDGKQCISTPVYDDFMLVTDLTYNEIFQISLNDPNTAIGIRTPMIGRADGVMYNYLTDEMMWTSTDQAQIWAITLNGSRQRLIADVYQEMQAYPDHIALDASTGNTYYTGVSYSSLSLNDSFIAVIDTYGDTAIVVWEGQQPRDLVLDPAEGLMFWTDYSATHPGIYRANMDGSSKQSLHTTDIVWPNGLAIDYQVKRIYWTDGSLDRISYSDYYGHDRHIFMEVDSGVRLMDIELVGDYIFFTSMGKQQVTGVNKNNISDVQMFGPSAGLGRLYGLDVYRSAATTSMSVNTECSVDNGGCSHFCFPTPEGRTCGCAWYAALLHDGKTCENAPLCPLVIPNGEVIVNSTCVGARGNKCQFVCDSGYRPRVAVQSITCTSTLDLLVAIPWDDLQWDIQDPCKEITCPDYIENGVIYAGCSLLPHVVCTYRCSDGFDPDLNMTHVMCEDTGTWDYAATNSTLCHPMTSTTVTQPITPIAAPDTGSNTIAIIGAVIGVGIVILVVIGIIIFVLLIRTGKMPSPFRRNEPSGKETAFENPRYTANSVQLGPTGGEADTSFGYSTLQEDKMAASATNTTYDNIKPII